ncbi:hypothetical protein [Williamsia sp.]|uniref:hypothetical protein n=1 Tax=Williamsia sp. TaxID=1872085 RepID=UPI002F947394
MPREAIANAASISGQRKGFADQGGELIPHPGAAEEADCFVRVGRSVVVTADHRDEIADQVFRIEGHCRARKDRPDEHNSAASPTTVNAAATESGLPDISSPTSTV